MHREAFPIENGEMLTIKTLLKSSTYGETVDVMLNREQIRINKEGKK